MTRKELCDKLFEEAVELITERRKHDAAADKLQKKIVRLLTRINRIKAGME